MESDLFGFVGVKAEFFKQLAVGAAKLPCDVEVGCDSLGAIEVEVVVVENFFTVNSFVSFVAFVKEVYAALVGGNLVDFHEHGRVLRTVGDSNTLACNGAEAGGGDYECFVGGNFVLIVTPIAKVGFAGFFVDGENFALCVSFEVLCIILNGILGSDGNVGNNIVLYACVGFSVGGAAGFCLEGADSIVNAEVVCNFNLDDIYALVAVCSISAGFAFGVECLCGSLYLNVVGAGGNGFNGNDGLLGFFCVVGSACNCGTGFGVGNNGSTLFNNGVFAGFFVESNFVYNGGNLVIRSYVAAFAVGYAEGDFIAEGLPNFIVCGMLRRVVVKNFSGNNTVAFNFNVFVSAGFKNHCEIYNAAHAVSVISGGVISGVGGSGPYVCVCNFNVCACGAGYFLSKVNNVHCKGGNAHCSHHHNRKHKSKSFFHVFFSSVLFFGNFLCRKTVRALRTFPDKAILPPCDKTAKAFLLKPSLLPFIL